MVQIATGAPGHKFGVHSTNNGAMCEHCHVYEGAAHCHATLIDLDCLIMFACGKDSHKFSQLRADSPLTSKGCLRLDRAKGLPQRVTFCWALGPS